MIELQRLCEYSDQLMAVAEFEDYCPNGLQVDAGGGQVQRLVSGVTASQALIDQAIGFGADLLLVHHGYFWRGEPAPLVGIRGRRVRALMQAGIGLVAYHLPLDAHPEFGNNRQLGRRLGLVDTASLPGQPLIWHARLEQPETPGSFAGRIHQALDRAPLTIVAGERPIERVGWCTGAAESYIEQAAAAGLDAFVSGEIAEPTTHLARELGIHYFAAGHHATERYGVQALAEHLAERFSLEHRFIDVDNPV